MKPNPELGIASPFSLISFSQRSSGQCFLCLLRKPIVFLHTYCLGKDVKESAEHSEGCQRGTFRPPNLTQVEVITYLAFVVFKILFHTR